MSDLTTCIGCGCDDDHACLDYDSGEPCNWLRQDLIVVPGRQLLGVCSACPELTDAWDAGDRELRVPVDIQGSVNSQEARDVDRIRKPID